MLRRRPKIASTTTCASCGVTGPLQLADATCAACHSAAAWAGYADKALVIERSEAERARSFGKPRRRLLLPIVHTCLAASCLLVLALAVAASASALGPIQIASLEEITSTIYKTSTQAIWLGLFAFALGVAGAIVLVRGKQVRSLVLLAVYSAAIVAGLSSAAIGRLQRMGASSDHLPYVSMPSLDSLESLALTPALRRIVDSTVVVLAPDDEGDARNASIGTGAIISSQDDRAWVITCSHVAIPGVASGALRDPAETNPLWIEFADGRGAVGKVVWAAAPPLDVVVVSISIDDPPPAVAILPSTETHDIGRSVVFVPNPLLHGWQVHYGTIESRRSHKTPAGTFALLMTSLPVVPGDSGSGLYDEEGSLIGLNTWTTYHEDGSRGISLPSEVLHTLEGAIASGNLSSLDAQIPSSTPKEPR